MNAVRPFIVDGVGKSVELIPILEHTIKVLNIAGVKTINPIIYSPVEFKHSLVKYFRISKLNYRDYNNFVVRLNEVWDEDCYGLLCQHDGFPLNPERWTDSFFDYDYIGAPWGVGLVHNGHLMKSRVGNGGFSLRSTNLFKQCAYLPVDGENEDFTICEIYKSHLESNGIKFAPVDIAAQFSYEVPLPDYENTIYNSFGFHGKQPREEVRQHYGL